MRGVELRTLPAATREADVINEVAVRSRLNQRDRRVSHGVFHRRQLSLPRHGTKRGSQIRLLERDHTARGRASAHRDLSSLIAAVDRWGGAARGEDGSAANNHLMAVIGGSRGAAPARPYLHRERALTAA